MTLHECQNIHPKTQSFYIFSNSTVITQGRSATKAVSDTQDMVVIDTDTCQTAGVKCPSIDTDTCQKANVKCPSIDTPGILVDLLTSVRLLHRRPRGWCSLYLIDE